MSIKTAAAALVASTLAATPSLAAPILGGGWDEDQIIVANAPSVGSPYLVSLLGPAVFRITDAFLPGDVFKVYDFDVLILTTTNFANAAGFGDDAGADAAWMSADYAHGEVALAAGSHSLVVEGDGAAGLPAAFFTRLDSGPDAIPEPATFTLLGAALAGIGALRRRRA